MQDLLKPHRIVLILIAGGLVTWCVLSLNWTWLAEPKLAERRLVGGEGFEPPTLSV